MAFDMKKLISTFYGYSFLVRIHTQIRICWELEHIVWKYSIKSSLIIALNSQLSSQQLWSCITELPENFLLSRHDEIFSSIDIFCEGNQQNQQQQLIVEEAIFFFSLFNFPIYFTFAWNIWKIKYMPKKCEAAGTGNR